MLRGCAGVSTERGFPLCTGAVRSPASSSSTSGQGAGEHHGHPGLGESLQAHGQTIEQVFAAAGLCHGRAADLAVLVRDQAGVSSAGLVVVSAVGLAHVHRRLDRSGFSSDQSRVAHERERVDDLRLPLFFFALLLPNP